MRRNSIEPPNLLNPLNLLNLMNLMNRYYEPMRETRTGWFVSGALAGAAATLMVFTAAAAQKSTSKIVLENDKVRVKDAMFEPGDRPGMHTHDVPHVGVIIEGGTLELRGPDGKTETLKLEAGGVGYREANVTHEPINRGKSRIRVIEVEIKK
jgi:mannose-6-phosphate isomerase-like protein (cupin superfamily)